MDVKIKKIGVFVLAMAFISVAMFSSPNLTGNVIFEISATPSCGSVVNSNTEFDSDLSCSGDAVIIGTDGVTLDCKDYSLSGNTSGIGIYINASDVPVINCSISSFRFGIKSNDNMDRHIIRDNYIYNSTETGIYIGMNDTSGSIYDNIINHSVTYNGIVLDTGADYNRVYNNTILDVERVGIWAGDFSHTVIQDNIINTTSIYDGIYLNVTVVNITVENNFIYNTNTSGIWADNSFNGTFRNNHIESVRGGSEEDGIHFINSTGDIISNNYIYDTEGDGIEIYSVDNSLIENNTIYYIFYRGIYVDGSNSVIRGNNITNTDYAGIYSDSLLVNTTIENNILEEIYDEAGIYVYDSANNTIDNNNFNGVNSSYGLYFYDSVNDVISNNYLYEPYEYGIWVENSIDNATIINNDIIGDRDYVTYGYYMDYGIYLEDVAIDNNITNNTILYPEYNIIHIYDADNNVISNNNLSYSGEYGIRIIYSTNNTFEGNTIQSAAYGPIYNDYGAGDLINNNNLITSDYYGIEVDYPENITISNNLLFHLNIGVYLYYDSSNVSIINNTIYNISDTGIYVYYTGTNSKIIGNNISLCDYGIYGELINNTLANNTLSSHTSYGLYLTSSYNNTIYNNYFNSTNNAYDDGDNYWNITKTAGTNIFGGDYLGGNYWGGNYTGVDNDADGIGNTNLPYNNSGEILGAGDYLPLVTSSTPEEATTTESSSSAGSSYPVYLVDEDELIEGYTKKLVEGGKIEFDIGGEMHHIFVEDLAQDSITVVVQSTTQKEVMTVGDEKKFDVDGDGDYYDVSITLNGINKRLGLADLTVMTIEELIVKEVAEVEEVEEKETEIVQYTGFNLNWTSMAVIALMIVVLVVIVYFALRSGKKK